MHDLIEVIRRDYALDWHGIHGIDHFRRVMDNGRALAGRTGAKMHLVDLFAIFHDARRINDRIDPGHGRRAAELVKSLQGDLLSLSRTDCDLLVHACTYHTDGLVDGDPTVQTCWDADRLDLGRAGIQPLPEKLCTSAAKDPAILKWAYERSISG
ncbi:MAG: hypothetical protein V1792_03335 [Pseudomonadota bacterium]